MDSPKADIAPLMFLEHNCSGWREKSKSETYIVPPCYQMTWPNIPQYLPPGQYSFISEKWSDRNKGSSAENYILDAFAYYFQFTAQPAFIFHKYSGIRNRKNKKEQLAEIDMLVVHRDFGIFVIETKAATSSDRERIRIRHQEARTSLINVNNHLKDLFDRDSIKDVIMTNVVAMPYQSSQILPTVNEYANLCKENLRGFDDFDRWWNLITENDQNPIANFDYQSIIPLLFKFLPNIKVNIHKTLQQLTKQNFLKNPKICMGNPYKRISKATTEYKSLLKKEMDYITMDQSEVWTKHRQIIYGPYGSGKTVLAKCKAADLARSDEKVLVIVPCHLKKVYEKFFKIHASDHFNKNIFVISTLAFYHNFCYYETLAQSSHVFVDELLCPALVEYFHYPFQIHLFLDLLYYLFNHSRKILWVIPHLYSLAEESLCENKSVTRFAVQFMLKFKDFPSTKLKMTMRTSKEIHDYKSRLEFASLNNYPFRNHHFKDEYFQLAMNSTLGHSISGPYVKIIAYSDKYCENYHLQRDICEAKRCPFYFFCAHVIIAEITKLEEMQIEIEDIAITADYNEMPNIECVCYYLLTLPGFSSYATKVHICRYEELASHEWPVVIHVKDHNIARKYFNKQNPSLFIRNQHSLVISRCMVKYIIICYPDDLPVLSNKTFQDFKQYCDNERINENSYYKAYEHYKSI